MNEERDRARGITVLLTIAVSVLGVELFGLFVLLQIASRRFGFAVFATERSSGCR